MATVRYGDRNGPTVAVQPIGTYGSRIAVTTCSPSRATVNRDSVRCSSATANRGQRGGEAPVRVATPMTITIVKRTSSTSPLPRATNQSPCELVTAAALGTATLLAVHLARHARTRADQFGKARGSGHPATFSRRPAVHPADHAAVGDQPG